MFVISSFPKLNPEVELKHLVRVRRHTVVTQRCFTTRCSVTHYIFSISFGEKSRTIFSPRVPNAATGHALKRIG